MIEQVPNLETVGCDENAKSQDGDFYQCYHKYKEQRFADSHDRIAQSVVSGGQTVQRYFAVIPVVKEIYEL